MQSRCSTWQGNVRGMAALALLATCGLTGFADPPAAKNNSPKPLPKEIVLAWKKAGAEVGWMRVQWFGLLAFEAEKEGKPGDLPAFRFNGWKKGVLAKLPAPAAEPDTLDTQEWQVHEQTAVTHQQVSGLMTTVPAGHACTLARFAWPVLATKLFRKTLDPGGRHSKAAQANRPDRQQTAQTVADPPQPLSANG